MVRSCEGRVGVLNSTLRKQVIRSESIAVGGGFIGILGTVATCPHCAALASGIAGLANPLQQTFKDNSDTPSDTRTTLRGLSDKISNEFTAYNGLAMPRIYSDSDGDFETNFYKRLDALRAMDASCAFYTDAAAKAGEGQSTKK